MRVGIDISNIGVLGGMSHVSELLIAFNPSEFDIKKIIVWGGKESLCRLPQRPWIELIHEQLLDGSAYHRLHWMKNELKRKAKTACDVLFSPLGIHLGNFYPLVTMSQNILPFSPSERARFGISWQFLKMKIIEMQQIATFRKASGIIFLNELAHKIIEKRCGTLPEMTKIIPYGLSHRFRKIPKKQYNINKYSWDCPFRFLYVSKINVYKHQWNVVEAISDLRVKGLPVTLDLVGPAYSHALKRLNKTIMKVDPERKFITYHGKLPYNKINEFFHNSDSFIFASSCENLPNILLEAMASGLPIICSNFRPMPDILKDAGIYCNPENVNQIVDAMELLVSKEELRERLAWKAYRISENYSWSDCSKDTFSFISKVANTAL